jgi:hypothetical protein
MMLNLWVAKVCRDLTIGVVRDHTTDEIDSRDCEKVGSESTVRDVSL